MKRYLITIPLFLISTLLLKAQQTPFSENYFIDKFSLSPSYAGQVNPGLLVAGFRSDWSGIAGGPKTLTITYNDLIPVVSNAGIGGKIIYDRAGIFTQLNIMSSYSYKVKVTDDHFILFGLSAGIYHNTINLTEYYNDPGYLIDPSLADMDAKSKIKFMSDFSIAYNWRNLNAGFLFSNISFGDASYKEVDLKYNPLSNFRFHLSYRYDISEEWSVTPLVIIRGGKYVRSQFEIASQVIWTDRIWGSLVFRDPAIFGIGLGGKIIKGLFMCYNFNLASNVAMNAFNSHEISLGIEIKEFLKQK